jgi:hypothetical protein
MRSFIFYTPPQIFGSSNQGVRRVGYVTHKGEDRNVCRVLMGKPKGKRPLRRLRSKWEDGIIIYLRETGWGWGGVYSVGSG